MSDHVLLAHSPPTMPPSDSEGLLSPKQVAALRAAPITYRDRVTNRVRYAMVLADIRQLDIETATGISHSQLSRILNGHTGRGGKIELQLALRLADYFGCDVVDLFPLLPASRTRVS